MDRRGGRRHPDPDSTLVNTPNGTAMADSGAAPAQGSNRWRPQTQDVTVPPPELPSALRPASQRRRQPRPTRQTRRAGIDIGAAAQVLVQVVNLAGTGTEAGVTHIHPKV